MTLTTYSRLAWGLASGCAVIGTAGYGMGLDALSLSLLHAIALMGLAVIWLEEREDG